MKSAHSLNKSPSKQKYSFPKSPRFNSENKNTYNWYDVRSSTFYNLPSLFNSRSTTFGFGNKDIGLKYQKSSPSPETYRLSSDFDNKKKGFSFGESREDLEITGPFSEKLTKKYIPSPNFYYPKLQTDSLAYTIKPKLKDNSLQKNQKNPGPGSYNLQQIGSSNYYIQSKHSNKINFKISKGPRPDTLPLQKSNNPKIGPGSYDLKCTQLNSMGQYLVSNTKNSMARKFSKGVRPDPVIKHLLQTPGPNKYERASEFDQ